HTRLVSDWSSDVCSSDLPLPVLREDPGRRRVDPGSRYPAFARRGFDMGKPGGLLSLLQSPEGQSAASRSDHETHAGTARFQPAYQPPHHAHDGAIRLQVA